MPTSAEFDMWAWGLNTRADDLTGLTAGIVGAAPGVAAGGLTAVTVDLAIRAAQANSLSAAGLLRQLADECTERAAICAEYDRAMLDYERRYQAYRSATAEYGRRVEEAQEAGTYVGSPPSAPAVPAKPFPWVERSA